MNKLQIEMIIAAILLLIVIVVFLKKSQMSVKYSILWMMLPVCFLLVAIFINPLSQLSEWLGFEAPSNFIFIVILGLLIMICFALTIVISRQQKQINKLVQEMAIMKKKKEENDKKA